MHVSVRPLASKVLFTVFPPMDSHSFSLLTAFQPFRCTRSGYRESWDNPIRIVHVVVVVVTAARFDVVGIVGVVRTPQPPVRAGLVA